MTRVRRRITGGLPLPAWKRARFLARWPRACQLDDVDRGSGRGGRGGWRGCGIRIRRLAFLSVVGVWLEIPRRRLGRFGLELTEISLGAAFIGGRTDPLMDDPEAMTRRLDGVAVAAVQRALDAGGLRISILRRCMHRSERRIGMALAEIDAAPGLTISTKVGDARGAPVQAIWRTTSGGRWSRVWSC